MVGAGVEVFLHPPRDGRFVAPRDDAVDQPVAPTVGEVVVGEPEPPQVVQVVGQR